jgi:hypothetical protein
MKCPACNFTWDRFDVCETLPVHDCSKFREAAILGVGDHLHELILRWFGEDFAENCGCRSYVDKMNAWGVEGCRRRIDRIVRHLYVEAHKRGLLESNIVTGRWMKQAGARMVCRWMVMRAIRRGTELNGIIPECLHLKTMRVISCVKQEMRFP